MIINRFDSVLFFPYYFCYNIKHCIDHRQGGSNEQFFPKVEKNHDMINQQPGSPMYRIKSDPKMRPFLAFFSLELNFVPNDNL